MGDNYPCLTCFTHQIGEDLCELHPETTAFHDLTNPKMSQPVNQLDDTCAWISTHATYTSPITTTHILACICDKCGNQVTVTLCDLCAENWGIGAPSSRCGQCNGTLSWQLHNITTGEALTQINPSQL